MSRLTFLCLGLLAISTSCAGAQVWEKRIVPGLTYRMETDLNVPRQLHALRWTPKATNIIAKPELAGGTVYEADPTFGRETVSAMVKRTGAIAGINADFFPYTGDPLGLMVRDGRLVSLPFPNRTSFGWGQTAGAAIAKASILMVSGNASLGIVNFNQELGDNSFGLFSEDGGIPKTKGQTAMLRLKILSGQWKSGDTVVAQVMGPAAAGKAIAPGECALVATGVQAQTLSTLSLNERVQFKIDVSGFDWTKITQVTGGGPNLVTKGLVATDSQAEGFDDALYNKRHPRTAVGVTVEGDIWFVVIDGRQTMSGGATIDELARVMQRLGCMEAINLDGGGSSTMNIFNQLINRPGDGKEREVASGIMFYGKPEPAEKMNLVLTAPKNGQIGKSIQLNLSTDKGTAIANNRVLWTATGSGWIDQGGMLRFVKEGTVFVTAYVEGQTVSAGITVGK